LAKELIRKVPRQVCHADIFLDEVTEVADIVRAEFDKLEAANKDEDVSRTLEFTYEVDDKFVFSTLEELENHAGKVSQFSLNANVESRFKGNLVHQYSDHVLQVSGAGPIRLEIPAWLKSQEWGVFGRVERIMRVRENRIKTLTDSVSPQTLMLSGYTIFFLAILTFSPLSIRSSSYYKTLVVLFSAAGIMWFCFAAILVRAVWRKNFVYLRYSRQNEHEREAIRQERWSKLGWILLGAILGAVLGPLGQLLFAKWKH
jgi:hypothetical protein